VGATGFAFTPFIDPLPIWSPDWMWAVLLIPLCAAVAVVYKAVKCGSVSRIPREALILFITIVLGMVLAAATLAGIVKWME
jgi:hypothetical protein